jgi:dynein assembly factor 2
MSPRDVTCRVIDALLADALVRALGHPSLGPQEIKKFEKAFKDPEFCRMMADYVDEISDPKHRAEQEAYIRQLESEQKVPEGKQLLKPKAGFVVKTHKTQKGQREKLFINIVHSDMVDKPSAKSAQGRQQWSIPSALGPVRMEKDKSEYSNPLSMRPRRYTTHMCLVHSRAPLYCAS